MPESIQCQSHGESQRAFTRVHLTQESFGLGFNRDEPSEESEYPDAWCDEIIRAQLDGWDDGPDGLCKIVMICSGCYERAFPQYADDGYAGRFARAALEMRHL